MNIIAVKNAESIFQVQFEILSSIICDEKFLIGKKCSMECISVLSSINTIDESYFDEEYYELLCDVPYEVEEYGESKPEDIHKLIRNLDMQYKQKLYFLIQKVCREKINDNLPTPFDKERFLDALREDFSRFFDYFAISSYVQANLKSNFLELQIEVYKSGCFPCGWNGTYPNGNMLVYIPD